MEDYRYLADPNPKHQPPFMQSSRRKPLGIEIVTLTYTLFTTLLIGIFFQRINDPLRLLEGRVFVLVGMGILYAIYRAQPNRYTLFLRYLFPLSLLGYWYPDTYEFCQLFPNLDYAFASADQALFGCQPSIRFSQWLPQKIWSELFHMGYVSYYLLIAFTVLIPLADKRRDFERTAFIVLTSFFMYYLIYLFLPVAGPQYYFEAVGMQTIEAGHFPQLGDYFRTHTEMAISPGPDGFFRNLVEATQASGERPTAAFPSSHVGASTILMILLWKNRHAYFYIALPFYFFLCCATVYIQAHYLVDVIGGLVTAIVFYKFCHWLSTSVMHMDQGTL